MIVCGSEVVTLPLASPLGAAVTEEPVYLAGAFASPPAWFTHFFVYGGEGKETRREKRREKRREERRGDERRGEERRREERRGEERI